MPTTCSHEHTNYTRRVFTNGTHHICVQCKTCGRVIKRGDKLWLKSEDVPPQENILEFNEDLYLEREAEHNLSLFGD